MADSNTLTNVAIVGAGGNVGSFITNALLKTGKHNITAITRSDSQSVFPASISAKTVDYNDSQSLVDALRGQDVLIITISGRAPIQEVEAKLIRAAGEADVPWILPNEWSPDSANESIATDVPLFRMKQASRSLIEQLGKSSYIAIVTGFWYEYSLAIPQNYGFDFTDRKITFFDDGETKISTSTWPQIGRAVAAILSLPLIRTSPSTEPSQNLCLEDLRNKVIYINSFNASQRDMFASTLRVTGTKEEDWTITKEPVKERFAAKTNFLYTRIFFPNGGGDFEHKGTLNGVLGLPEEDIGEATRVAIERQKSARRV